MAEAYKIDMIINEDIYLVLSTPTLLHNIKLHVTTKYILLAKS